MSGARLRRWMLVLVAGVGMAACRTPTPPPLVPLAEDDPRPAAWVARLADVVDSRRALRGRARLAVDGAPVDGAPLRLRSKQRLVVARPARLRVEVEGWLGTTAAVLAIDEGRYAFLQAEERRFERGPAHDGLLHDVVGLDLSPAEAVDVLLGGPRLAGGWRVASAWGDGAGGLLVRLLRSGGRPTSLVFDAEARLVQWRERDASGTLLWQADFEDHVELDGAPFARRVTVSLGRTQARIVLADVELNPPLSPDTFHLSPLAAGGPGEGG